MLVERLPDVLYAGVRCIVTCNIKMQILTRPDLCLCSS